MNITKSAPLPERPCEQLTRCALCVCDPKHKHGNDSRYQAGGQCNYPLGSMPRRFSSALANSLNQLPRVRPSEVAASFTCWRSSLLILIWKVGDHPSPRGDLSRFNVDMYVRNSYYHFRYVRTISVGTVKSKAPQVSLPLAGLLTNNVKELNAMAVIQHTPRPAHTQTAFVWSNRFHDFTFHNQPGGRFLPDLSRRGYFSTKSSRAKRFCARFFTSGSGFNSSGSDISLARFSSSWRSSMRCKSCLRCSAKISVMDLYFLFMLLPCKAMRRSTSHHGADSDYSDSLALRRWRYSTSRFNAAVTNCPVLSPGIFTASTLFITSCGTLAATVCDFAFTAFVAMLSTPHKKQMQYAGKKTSVQHLTCLTPRFKLVFNTLLRQGVETTKPRSAGTHTGRLTNNVN